MKKVVSYLKSILSSGSDASSKRAVGVGVAVIIVIIAFINMFTGKAPDEYVFDGLISLEMIAFGGVAVENVGNAIGRFKIKQRDTTITNIDSQSTGIPKATL